MTSGRVEVDLDLVINHLLDVVGGQRHTEFPSPVWPAVVEDALTACLDESATVQSIVLTMLATFQRELPVMDARQQARYDQIAVEMTRRHAVRTVECPRCGSTPGKACRTLPGLFPRSEHADRRRVYDHTLDAGGSDDAH